MRAFFSILLFILVSFAANARQLSSKDSTENKTFIGAVLNSTIYEVVGKPKYSIVNGVVPIINVHYGYRLSKRSIIQVGFGYGINESSGGHVSRYVSADSVYTEEKKQNIQAVVFPVTLKFTPFNPYKRLQLYANASIVPVLGHIKARASESLNGAGSSTVLYDEEMYSITMITTAGLTLNYKISNRLDGFIDGVLLYKNYNFDRPRQRFYENKSAGIGINYKLR